MSQTSDATPWVLATHRCTPGYPKPVHSYLIGRDASYTHWTSDPNDAKVLRFASEDAVLAYKADPGIGKGWPDGCVALFVPRAAS